MASVIPSASDLTLYPTTYDIRHKTNVTGGVLIVERVQANLRRLLRVHDGEDDGERGALAHGRLDLDLAAVPLLPLMVSSIMN